MPVDVTERARSSTAARYAAHRAAESLTSDEVAELQDACGALLRDSGGFIRFRARLSIYNAFGPGWPRTTSVSLQDQRTASWVWSVSRDHGRVTVTENRNEDGSETVCEVSTVAEAVAFIRESYLTETASARLLRG